MSSIKVIFQKLPASERDFQEKLKSVSDSGSSDLHDRSALNEIQRLKIKQVSYNFYNRLKPITLLSFLRILF